MGKNKLFRFAVNELQPNIIQAGKPLYQTIIGNWNLTYFQNSNPIVLELGCGDGEYTVGLAQKYPDKNFIGMDIKGSRIYKGSILATELHLENVAFLRSKIDYIHEFFVKDEVSEIWITFPDPQPKDYQEKKRLTHPRFLEKYKSIIKNEGIIHLKTDSLPLYLYTLQVINDLKLNIIHSTDDLYATELQSIHMGIQTKYEKMFLKESKKINYLSFKF
ncbi:MAG: tRNA (guanosine(46)-N7)-methyltransferase TrmB [Bacteroidota bacterium]|nr:tRNA (guanosine(46)-N7)-methyltransferase TrmB [Bacteroidota bacterium]